MAGPRLEEARALSNLALVFVDWGSTDHALDILEKAVQLVSGTGARPVEEAIASNPQFLRSAQPVSSVPPDDCPKPEDISTDLS